MTNNKPLLFLNWKMFLNIKEMNELISDVKKESYNLTILAPYHLLGNCANSLGSQHNYGGQNVDHKFSAYGARTGGISAAILKDLGCKFCLVGHSEVREFDKDSDDDLVKKIDHLHQFDITPILCIGEKIDEQDTYIQALRNQLDNVLKRISSKKEIVIAYEPLFAIGTGVTAELPHVCSVVEFLTNWCSKEIENCIKILYGGSINHTNIKSFSKIQNLDGFLVGSAGADIHKLNKLIAEIK